MPVTVNSGSALLNAAFVGIPGIPNAFEAVLFRVVPTIVFPLPRIPHPQIVQHPRI